MNSENNNIHIFVVDDEQGICDLLKMELSAQGYAVKTFTNPVEALENLGKQKVDLVISDLKMPQMDGIEFLKKIKTIDSSIEVIMSTGYGTVENAVLAMKSGAYDFVLKPFNVEEMVLLVEKCIEKRQLKALLALYESSKAIFSTIRMEELFPMVMDLLPTVLGADEGSLMLLTEEKKLKIVASRGLSEKVREEVHLKLGERVAGKIALSRQPMLLVNGLEKYPEFKDIQSNPRIKSSIVCPLLYQGKLLGILNVNRIHSQNDFTVVDLHSASIFTSQVAMAIQNAKLYESLRQAFKKLQTTQNQLVQSEKLASVGQLVAGVAHELNNPLTSVIGYSQLAIESDINLKDIRNHLTVILEQAQRCSKIVKELLLFSRPHKPDFQWMNPFDLIEQSLTGMKLELEKRNIEVTTCYAPESVVIPGDIHLLKQVITNILTNAFQALEEVRHPRKLEIIARSEDKKIQIYFKDNGPGINGKDIHKIFDPFFSTKGVGKGTGLGLSLCYGIMKEHGGNIFVKSERGNGTTFILEFCIQKNGEKILENKTQAAKEVEKEEKVIASFPKIEIKKILLVEDEEPIRRLIMTILSSENFEFDSAADGEIALQKLNEQNYDLVLCDYRIPKLDGLKLYQKVKKMKPEMINRFIFVSGSSQFIGNYETLFKDSQLNYLLKPFTKNELLTKIRSIANFEPLKEKEGDKK